MTTSLVTGGSGYFGGVLVRHLLARGERVRVFDLIDTEDRPQEVEFVRGDIRDARAVDAACEGARVVYHNVAQVPLAKDRELFHSVNVLGTRYLLEAAASREVVKVVLTSSSAVFGVPESNPVTEATETHPGEAYGRAKREAERLAHGFVERGLDVTVVRPRTILGHGRLGIFQILFEWVRSGRPVYVLGGGHNRYQFVHADDLADACLRAADRPGPSLYNIGAERFGTMRELLAALIRHAVTGSRIRSIPFGPGVFAMRVTSALGLSPLAPYHWMMYGREMFFDITKARRELGYAPRWSNEEMICQSYDDYVAHRTEILARREASAHRSTVKRGVLRILEHLP